ncbi:helix-turn-helix transcriptional regulator [Streptomyces tricolor]|uniref:Helix-turn-helix transcriptional regulator n=1 Tax=Streptomyces tricolor TaxID=68277 RepID=A0ABS9JRT2_9ACTN|nr:helix-turn-helix transcriptional regulator [Streptomyces tricolor]MCG0068189.1 helix-turn-helix transcriptional regulator [Streptomyces tricolor]
MSAGPARLRRFVDAGTGEQVDLYDLDDEERRTSYNFPGGFSAVSNEIGLAILNKESGLTPSDRDVLALHVHGPEKRGDVLRWSRQKMADWIGVTPRTIAASIRKLVKAGLLFEAERHGRTIYYRASPHHASRMGGEQQTKDTAAYRRPVAPGIPERKETA